MDSTTRSDSLVILGKLYTNDGIPIMASLLIDLKNKKGMVEDFGIITSSYDKSISEYNNLLNKSTIRYIEPNKKRTNAWLKALGLRLPSALTKCGSINKLSSTDGFVNIELKQG